MCLNLHIELVEKNYFNISTCNKFGSTFETPVN